MATKTLQTRLQLKYDTYSNWTTNNPVLLAGEIAISTVPGTGDGVHQAPAVLMKVGDGTTPYKELKFVSGMAANVHNWALADTKPTYKASEITELADFINTTIQDTNTTYQIVKVDDYNYKLQSKELGGDWADVTNGAIAIPKYDDTEVKADIEALEGLVGTTAVATQIANAITALDLANTYEAKGAAATEAGKVQTALDTYKGTNDAAVAANAKAIEDEATTARAAEEAAQKAADDAQADVDALAGKVGTVADGSTVVGMIGTAQAAAEAAQGDVDTLAGKVGEVAEGKTVVGMIADAQTAATYDDTEVRGLITAAQNAADAAQGDVDTLTQTHATDKKALEDAIALKADNSAFEEYKTTNDAAVKANTDEIARVNSVLVNALDNNQEGLDSIKELATWVDTHGKEAATMAGNITQNANDITALEGRMDTAETALGTVDSRIAAAAKTNKDLIDANTGDITALKGRMDTVEGGVSTNADDIEALDGRLTTAEGEIDALQADTHTHTNKALLDTYTQTEADLADAVTKKHAHANADVLDGISADDVTAWDGAVTRVGTLEGKVGTVAEGKTVVGMIGTAQAAAEAAQADVDALEGKVGTVAEGKTVVEMIADAQTAATYDDTEVRGLISGNTTAISGVSDRVTSLETNAVLESDTLILQCGTSVIA